MTAREEAIADCKYAKSLGDTALNQHFLLWEGFDIGTAEEVEYYLTMNEIFDKLDTNEDLLRD